MDETHRPASTMARITFIEHNGTEPDLRPAHWAGTREEYFAHYDYTVEAVRSVLPDARIGPGNILNPRYSKRWGLDIIDHLAKGANALAVYCQRGLLEPHIEYLLEVRVSIPAVNDDWEPESIR